MCRKSLLTYYPPLSDLKILIFFPDALSIKAFNSVNFPKTSDFFLIKKDPCVSGKVINESENVPSYLDSFMDVIGMGLLIS